MGPSGSAVKSAQFKLASVAASSSPTVATLSPRIMYKPSFTVSTPADAEKTRS